MIYVHILSLRFLVSCDISLYFRELLCLLAVGSRCGVTETESMRALSFKNTNLPMLKLSCSCSFMPRSQICKNTFYASVRVDLIKTVLNNGDKVLWEMSLKPLYFST